MSSAPTLIKNPRAIFEAPHDPISTPDVHPPAHHVAAAMAPHPDEADDLKPLEGEGIATGEPHASAAPGILKHLEPLKRLAKKSLPLLQHMVALRQAYVNDPQLGSKEAKTEMAAIMSLLFREDEAAVYFFGQVLFEPNVGSFITLFDDIGAEKMGPYLGINNLDQIPGAKAGAGMADQVPHPTEPAPPGPVPAPPTAQAGAPNLPQL